MIIMKNSFTSYCRDNNYQLHSKAAFLVERTLSSLAVCLPYLRINVGSKMGKLYKLIRFMFPQMITSALGHRNVLVLLNIHFRKENKKMVKKQISSYLLESDLLSCCVFGLTYLLAAFAIFTDLVDILTVWISLIEARSCLEKWNLPSLNFFDIYFSFFEQSCKINLFEFYVPCVLSLSWL